MSITAPGYYITPASPVVVEQITRLNEQADKVNVLALDQIENLTGLHFANADLDPRFDIDDGTLESVLNELGNLPDFDPNTDWLAGLSLSAGNEDFRFNPELYQYLRQMLPEYNLPPLGDLPPEPVAPAEPTEVALPDVPDRPILPEYTSPEVDLDTPAPVYEDFTAAIPFPELRPITLPPAPTINTDDIVFEGVAPNFDATPPDPGDFAFENGEYVAQLLEQTKAKVLEIFDGQTGLPAAVEDALFERAREREGELASREIEEATDGWGARGWKYPPGMLAAAFARARDKASDKTSQLNRDQFIEHHRARLDMLKVALSTAMAAEDVYFRVFNSAEDRRLQATRFRVEIALQVYNAYIARFQAESQLFAVQAQVFNQKFQAAMAKLQLYSEQLRAQSMIGDLNQQDIEIFARRVGALQANAEIYRAKVEGFKALYEAVDAKVNVYRAQLESNQTLMEGYATDSRVFSTQVEASLANEQRYKTRADIYASNVGARRQQLEGLLAQQENSFKRAELTRETFASNTDRIRAFIDGEQGRIGALRDKYAALSSEIGAKSEVERARYTLMLSLAEAKISRYKAAADILLKNGEINIQAGLSADGLLLRAQETAATTLSQLAAGYTSAANVHAGITDSSSSSIGYNFSGELDVN